jgi:hypothetical protein
MRHLLFILFILPIAALAQKSDTLTVTLKPAQEQYLLNLENQIVNLSNPDFVKAQVEALKAEQIKAIMLLFGEGIEPKSIRYIPKKDSAGYSKIKALKL